MVRRGRSTCPAGRREGAGRVYSIPPGRTARSPRPAANRYGADKTRTSPHSWPGGSILSTREALGIALLRSSKPTGWRSSWQTGTRKASCRRCERVSPLAGLPRGPQYRGSVDHQLAIDVAEFTVLRQKGGDPGRWKTTPRGSAPSPRSITARFLTSVRADLAEPRLTCDRQGGRRAVRRPGVALGEGVPPRPGRPGVDFRSALINSPLLGVTPFRKLVLEGLTSRWKSAR